MGVFKRVRKHKTTYYVSFMFDGRLVQEKAGTDARAAERLERQRKHEVANGIYVRGAGSGTTASFGFEKLATDYFAERRREPDPPATLHEDEARILNHVLPRWQGRPVFAITDDDVVALLHSVQTSPCATGRPPAANTVTNVFSALSVLLDEAERLARKRGISWTNPCKQIRPRDKPRKRRNPRSYYRRHQVVALLSDARIPPDRRALYHLLFYTGMRISEAAGLRVGDIEWDAGPLARITVRRQARRSRLKEDRYGVGLTREVPVHPVLAAVLSEWIERGFAGVYGPPPGPTDYLMPSTSRIDRDRPIRTTLKQLHRDCAMVGVEARTTHETRNSFLTLACEDAPHLEHVIQRITHQPPKHASETYKRSFWLAMCEAVSLYTLMSAHDVDGDSPARRGCGAPSLTSRCGASS